MVSSVDLSPAREQSACLAEFRISPPLPLERVSNITDRDGQYADDLAEKTHRVTIRWRSGCRGLDRLHGHSDQPIDLIGRNAERGHQNNYIAQRPEDHATLTRMTRDLSTDPIGWVISCSTHTVAY